MKEKNCKCLGITILEYLKESSTLRYNYLNVLCLSPNSGWYQWSECNLNFPADIVVTVWFSKVLSSWLKLHMEQSMQTFVSFIWYFQAWSIQCTLKLWKLVCYFHKVEGNSRLPYCLSEVFQIPKFFSRALPTGHKKICILGTNH